MFPVPAEFAGDTPRATLTTASDSCPPLKGTTETSHERTVRQACVAMAEQLHSKYDGGEQLPATELQRVVEEKAGEAVRDLELSGAMTLQALTGVCRRFTETLQQEVAAIDVARDARQLREASCPAAPIMPEPQP